MRIDWPAFMKKARARAGLSQLKLATIVRVPAAELSRIESGKMLPSTALCVRVSEAVKVPLSQLIADAEG